MLKQVSRSIGAVVILFMLSAMPASAQQSNMEMRKLESQIAELQAQVRDLKNSTVEMQKLLQAVAVAVLQDNAAAAIGASEQSSCENRLQDLHGKRDQLRTLGFSDKYPDIVTITNMINTVQQECAALAASVQP